MDACCLATQTKHEIHPRHLQLVWHYEFCQASSWARTLSQASNSERACSQQPHKPEAKAAHRFSPMLCSARPFGCAVRLRSPFRPVGLLSRLEKGRPANFKHSFGMLCLAPKAFCASFRQKLALKADQRKIYAPCRRHPAREAI